MSAKKAATKQPARKRAPGGGRKPSGGRKRTCQPPRISPAADQALRELAVKMTSSLADALEHAILNARP